MSASVPLDARTQAEDFLARTKERGQVVPLATGIDPLDEALGGGIRDGALVALGGAPGAGKTALALQLALRAARVRPVGYLTAEQGVDELLARLLAAEAGCAVTELLDGRPTAIAAAYGVLDRLPLGSLYLLSDPPSEAGSVAGLRQAIIAIRDHLGVLPFVSVDYLQRLQPPAVAKAREPRLAVMATSQACTNLVRELQVPLVLISALNRLSQQDEMPLMSSFRESGSIEYDADVAMILRRRPPGEGDLPTPIGTTRVELHIVKHRVGILPPRPVSLLFDGRLGSFRAEKSEQLGRSVSMSEVVEALGRDGEWPSITAAATTLGATVPQVSKVLDHAVRKGCVIETSGVFRLTSPAPAEQRAVELVQGAFPEAEDR